MRNKQFNHLHRAITYGQPAEERRRLLSEWDEFYVAASQDGKTRFQLAPSAWASALGHLCHRFAAGRVTSIPAGIIFLLGAASAASFAFVPEDPMPNRVHFHIALGLLAIGTVFVRWPRWQPPKALGLAAVVFGTSWPHGTVEAVYPRYSDYLIGFGGGIFTVGSLVMVRFAFSEAPEHRSLALKIYAVASVFVGLGNLDWSQAALSPGYAAACFISASLVAVVACLILRLTSQTPA